MKLMKLYKSFSLFCEMGALILACSVFGPAILKAASGPSFSSVENGLMVQGRIVFAVTYDRAGKVAECRLVRSNVPVELEASTVEYIRTHWDCPFFAGTTVTLPIEFDGDSSKVHWNGDFPLPPNLFPYDNQKYAMKLRLTFNGEGWISHVKAIQSSGIQLADDQTGAWIQAHWHHVAYAGQVVDVPLEFTRPLAPSPKPLAPPPVSHVVSKPKPAPEPVAVPAIRVQ